MEFGIEKCAMLIKRGGKRQITEGIELPNQEKKKQNTEKETYKYLGILEADAIKSGHERKNIKEYLWRTRKFLKTKLCCRNLIKGINNWAVPLVRYSGPFLK